MMPYGKINNREVLFIHIPKTAGKSIKAHLKLAMNCHYPASWFEKKNPERFKNAFKFSFVRNPWDRVSSMYRYYREVEPNAYVKQLTFEQFVGDICCNTGPMFGEENDTILKLTQLQFLSSTDGKLAVDFVGKYENLEHDLKNLCSLLSIPVSTLKENRRVSSNRNIDYRTQYNHETRDLVAKKFEKEIQMWNYKFETKTGEEK